MDLSELEGELANCQACPLRQDAIAPVGWYGNPESPIVFVGEGPGQVEDDYGCPLIGPSGQLLDKALWAAKMTRDRVLTTNVIKCRPKNNRTPDIAEADFCAKQFRTEQGFDCIATYHPAYLLRQYGKQLVASKWDVFHDLEAARERAALLAPGYEFMSEEKPDLFKIFKKRIR